MKKWFFMFFIVFVPISAMAQGNYQVSTTIPSAVGHYDRLRLVPRPTITTPCDGSQTGFFYTEQSTDRILYCNGIDWVILSPFYQSGNDIIPSDSTNPDLKLGIGVDPVNNPTDLTLTLIGNRDPSSQSGGGIVTNGSYGIGPTLQTNGIGARFIWYPRRGAVRAGVITGNGPLQAPNNGKEWNDANIGNYSVAFGHNNLASGLLSVIGGGENNSATGLGSTIAGGLINVVDGLQDATIGGGRGNESRGVASTVAGGWVNKSLGNWNSVGGGYRNTADNEGSTISGGRDNVATGWFSTVAGGNINQATHNAAAIGGGSENTISGAGGVISGGLRNTAEGDHNTVGGGFQNRTSEPGSTIGGGADNTASGQASTIAGGNFNIATTFNAVVGGGLRNTASGSASTVAGGATNTASGNNSVVSGGDQNMASGGGSVVIGGSSNTASGAQSVILGGTGNNTESSFTIVGGRNMNLGDTANNTFLWGSSNTPTAPINTSNAFLISSGRVGIGQTAPSTILHITGANLPTLFIENSLDGQGARIILEDSDGVGCTQITANNGVISGAAVSCP